MHGEGRVCKEEGEIKLQTTTTTRLERKRERENNLRTRIKQLTEHVMVGEFDCDGIHSRLGGLVEHLKDEDEINEFRKLKNR